MFSNYVDYKKLYLKMARATEEAMQIIEEAHRECKEIYVEAATQELEDLHEAYKAGGGTIEMDDMEIKAMLDQIEEDDTY